MNNEELLREGECPDSGCIEEVGHLGPHSWEVGHLGCEDEPHPVKEIFDEVEAELAAESHIDNSISGAGERYWEAHEEELQAG